MTAKILNEIAATSERIGAIPLFVHIPAVGDAGDLNLATDGEKFLMDVCQTRGKAHCFSVRSLFAEKKRQGVNPDIGVTGHWGPVANSIIAEGIHQYLTTNNVGLLPGGAPSAAPAR